MIAELLEGGNLSTNRDRLSKYFDFRSPALDGVPACARRLKPDKDYRVFRIGKPLRQVMQDAPASHHPARRDDDRWKTRVINLLRFFRGRGEGETRPLHRRPVLGDQLAR